VELIRNVPLLLQLLFWYNAVLKALPDLRDSWTVFGHVYLNNRGFFAPYPIFQEGIGLVVGAFIVGVVGAIAFRIWAKKRQEKTGQQAPIGLVALGLIVGLPIIAVLIAGMPATLEYPEKGRFNIRGGMEILPEFVALLIGLVLYTGAFIAEVVRAGIMAVSKGQTEAAGALGLRTGPTLKLVVIPQAMRVIIPPLTNQYLNLTKNSSLAVFVGYPDLVQIFTGTVLNQTGQAVEVVMITMAVYLSISLVTSMVMNWYNARIALVER
jgi:general L-amino acid transport system permease protein